MKSQRRCDVVAGCFVALLGLVVVVAASRIRGDVEERLPPRTLPYAVGFMTLAGGTGLAVRSWRFRGEDPAVKWPDGSGAVRIAVNLALLALYTALMNPLGMPVSTGLYVASSIFYIDRRRWRAAILAGAGSAAVVYLLFIKLLALTFPMGFLER